MPECDKSGDTVILGRADDVRPLDFGHYYSSGSLFRQLSRPGNEEKRITNKHEPIRRLEALERCRVTRNAKTLPPESPLHTA